MHGQHPEPDLEHDEYGEYSEQPSTVVELTYEEWDGVVKTAVESVNPDVAWEYRNNHLYMWGDSLSESLFDDLVSMVEGIERTYKMDGAYKEAQAAKRVVTWLQEATIVTD